MKKKKKPRYRNLEENRNQKTRDLLTMTWSYVENMIIINKNIE